ncbi:MAG: hypothetical protein C0621_06455 [Desulfuromonas sp.]|nr:MAG: hypothetical protein C0621_06455 [Desulfuromonas sp.]
MRREVQAHVAYTAARLSANWNERELLDKEGGAKLLVDPEKSDYRLQSYPFRPGCDGNKSCDGVNHCLVDASGEQHICLSLYGKLFDGYNRAEESHFSGMIYDYAVEIYDFSESDFFRFEKA